MINFSDAQLKFELDGFDENETDESFIDPQKARQISEASKLAVDERVERGDKQIDEWMADYLKLINMGWPWRVAVYIAWAASPKLSRWPKTITELSTAVLGLTSPRTIYHWRRKYATIDSVVAMLQAAPLLEHRRDVLDALVEVASKADYKGFNDRKLFLELIGDYVPKSEIKARLGRVKDLSELSDEELDRLADPDHYLGDNNEGDEVVE